jgi:Na+-driven multidrug efflux pump
MFHAFISVAPWFVFFVAIEHLGKTELAITNITRSVSTMFFVIVNSFAATTGSLVSNQIGAGHEEELFPICRKVLKLGYAIGFPLVGIALICNHWIIGFYTGNPLLIKQTVSPLFVTLLNYTFSLPGYVFINAVTGIGKTNVAFIFQVVTIAIYLIYLYWLSLCTHIPLTVYMLGEYIFVCLLAVQSFIYLKTKYKQLDP